MPRFNQVTLQCKVSVNNFTSLATNYVIKPFLTYWIGVQWYTSCKNTNLFVLSQTNSCYRALANSD